MLWRVESRVITIQNTRTCVPLWLQTTVSLIVSVPIIPEPEVKSEGKEQIKFCAIDEVTASM